VTSRLLAAVITALGTIVAFVAASAGPASSVVLGVAGGNNSSPAPGGIVWLCRPGQPSDPCTSKLTATVVRANGTRRQLAASPAKKPPIDCFYIYPTVSTEQTVNANLEIQPAEKVTAMAQASRFSQVCRVYAPMYRQVTLKGLATGLTPAHLAVAFSGVLAAWKQYLARYNHGRGVVIIGHSQGAAMAIKLMQTAVDDVPSVRRRLVSALVMGGNVAVPVGKGVGGSFRHIPACRSTTQTGCVVAYSSFSQTPPADTLFGKVGTGVSILTGQKPNPRLQVLCVNPARPAGGTADLNPYFIGASGVQTPWVTYPVLYAAHCMTRKGITWLQVDDIAKPGDDRPVVSPTDGPQWGLHVDDVNLALGNLVALVRTESQAYLRGS
jgi:hypothetical protein